ncbi:DUF3823 domain-containing protein [Pontibacter harenae]|uniref:DUF3823 domain-containing protein n=1 Tax=Pontibacter harenae TaxID=2894083 RepID=UPI001E483F45|nr:DUF3823 domain-containing protein [Pontibacter harenae]MCC9165789.1 DUF3823 domain-containing protein [Pontibacter harenae]
MKIRAISYLIAALVVVLTGCEKDNYEPPTSTLTGRVVYNGEPVNLRSNGVQLELWQRGYQNFEKIPVYVAQDGTYSATLFDGNYKLVLLPGNGPWVNNTDSLNVQVNGSTTIDVPVQPYFNIQNETFQLSGNVITTTVDVNQVTAGRELERITYYLSGTTIVDAQNWAAVTDIWWPDPATLEETKTMSLTVPANLVSKGYVFARVGLKIAGIEEMLYTPVHRVELN